MGWCTLPQLERHEGLRMSVYLGLVEESYEEALKVACKRALQTAEVLRSDIERLSQRMRNLP